MEKINFMDKVLLRYREAVLVPIPEKKEGEETSALVSAAVLNMMSIGMVPDNELFQAMQELGGDQVARLTERIMEVGREAVGDDVKHMPMYPNFPTQVMETDLGLLYLNAIAHYITDGKWLPEYEKLERPALTGGKLVPVGVGSAAIYHQVFVNLMSANSPLSGEDQEFLATYLQLERKPHIPEDIPIKETCAMVEKVLWEAGNEAAVRKLLKTPTDVLRFSQAIVGGDFSLRSVKKFGPYGRKTRKFMLRFLQGCNEKGLAPEMDMHKALWIRLGEQIHPGEEANRRAYPKAAKAFDLIRSGERIPSFEGDLEVLLAKGDMAAAAKLLTQRPGIFARKLDRVLRLCTDSEAQHVVLTAWHSVAAKVSTRVLLQLLEFLKNRETDIRVFRPAASSHALYVKDGSLPPMSEAVRAQVTAICETALKSQFLERPFMGRVYIDPELKRIAMPLEQRNSSGGYRILPSRSRLPLPDDCNVLRCFLYWENYNDGSVSGERTDMDLSAVFMDSEFQQVNSCSYMNLRAGNFSCHSGDLVDAPIGKGASEFVDVDIQQARENGVRYMLCSVNAYTRRPFDDLKTVFGGWMFRDNAKEGEVYEPATVESKSHLTGDRANLPFIVDLENRELIWLDIHAGTGCGWSSLVNNVETRSKMNSGMVKALTSLVPLSIAEVVSMHVAVRGVPVDDPAQADLVFSMDTGVTPYNTDELLAYI